MKALILAGGRGTRLRPLTHTKNKHLLPVANEPMIARVIKDAADLGIKDVIVNINKGDTELQDALRDGSDFGVKITYIEQPEPNGMMYPIKLAQDLIGDEEFLFSAGDNILAGGLKQHYKDFKNKGSDAHVLVVKRPDYQNFGVAVMENDRIVKTVEKPKKFVSDLVLTAIYFFTPEVFKSFDHIKPIDPKKSGVPEYYPPTVINWMTENDYHFSASEVTGWWKDTGMPDDIIIANSFVLGKKQHFDNKGKHKDSKIEGNVEVMEGSSIENSVIRGPVSIGKNVTIKNSYIGPFTSVGDNCIIENSEVENSILMENVEIQNVSERLDNCLIGMNAKVSMGKKLPATKSLLIGDDSILML